MLKHTMDFPNDLFLYRLLVMFTCLLCILSPATSDEECSPYCTLILDTNTTQVDVKTPGYPSNYPQDTKLLWVIETPSHCGLLLTIEDIELATGDMVKFGHGNEARFIIKADDEVEAMINRTISFARNDVTWVTFASDNDNATARGFWLTVTADPDAPESSYTSSTMTTLSSELPLVNLSPAVYRRLGVSIPLAAGLVIIAFGLGAGVVCCHRKRKRGSVNARLSETRITLEMCDNPMTTVTRDVNLNTPHGSLGPDCHYYEIGEGAYNLLFGASAPKSPHVYQELSKDPCDKESGRSRSNVRRDGSEGSLSIELDDEFCELTTMIDEMLGEVSDELSPLATSQHSLGEGSPGDVRFVGSLAEQRSRAQTADFPRTRHSPAFRHRSLFADSVHPSANQTEASSLGMPTRKYAVSTPNINASDEKLKPGRGRGSLSTSLGHVRNEDDSYNQLNFKIDPTYQPLACTMTAHAAKRSREQLAEMPEYAVLERDNPEDVSAVCSRNVSDDGSWVKLDTVETPTEQRPRAYTSELPRRFHHYTALRSRSLLLESFPPFAAQRQLLNQAALENRIARRNPNLNSVGIQLWTNNLHKSSESLNKLTRRSRDDLHSLPPGGRVGEDAGDDDEYSEIEDEESIYQPLSRPTSMGDLTDGYSLDNEGTPPPLPPIQNEMNKESGQNFPIVDGVIGRELTTVGSFHLVSETCHDDDDGDGDNDDYNEIEGEESIYQPLSRPMSMEDLTNGWSLNNKGTPPPLPPTQYEMNGKSGPNPPTVDVVLGRELTTVGSFHLVSAARRSDKMASAVHQGSQSDDCNYDVLNMEDNVELPSQTNPGNLYIEILDDNLDVLANVGTDNGTRESQYTVPSEDTSASHHLPEASGTTYSQDTSNAHQEIGHIVGQPTEGFLQCDSRSQSSCHRMTNSNRFSTTSGVYSSMGPAGYEDDIDIDDGIYNGIDSYISDDDDDIHEYISVDDVLR